MASTATAGKLGRMEAALAELSSQTSEDLPELEKHVRTAAQALQKARALIEAKPKTAERRSAVPVKSAPVSRKIASPAPRSGSVDGRSPKKKGIYRARRKSWPKR